MKKGLVGVLVAGTVVVLAAGAALAFGGKKAPDVINNTIPGHPGPGAETEAEAESADRFVETEPVKQWGTIVSADGENGRITVLVDRTGTDENGNPVSTKEEFVYNVADGTPIIDAVSGLPVSMSDLKEGDPMYAWIARATTMSLPPQSALQAMVVNIPADYAAPQYVVVKEAERSEDGSLMITDQDGNRYAASEEGTSVTPYLTRNMVFLDAIEEGTRCMIWVGPAVGLSEPPLYQAEKIMVFAS